MSVVMQAPAGVSPSSTFKSPITQISYAIDALGFVTVNSLIDTVTLSLMGFQKLPGGRNNLAATTDPTTSDDSSLDYAAFSAWINQAATNNSGTVPRAWLCSDASVGSAKWFQISIGSSTPGTAEFTHLILDGLLTGSCSQVIAFSGGGQASATQLTTIINNVVTATSSSSPYDSVKLPAATPGRVAIAINSASNPFQIFGLGTDTINAFAAATGFYQPVGSIAAFYCRDNGKWSALNLDMGFVKFHARNTNAATASTTLNATDVSGGISDVYLDLTGTLSVAANATLPTVAALVSAIPNPVAGRTYRLRLLNSSSGDFTWTVVTNTGWTLTGTMTIDTGGWRDFLVTLTTLTTATLVSIGASPPTEEGLATDFVYNTNSATSGTTLTGANISGGEVEVTLAMTGTMGGDANAQLPTVANLVAAIPDAVAGSSYKIRVLNLSSANHVWTVTTNTGWTLNGTMTIAQNASRMFYVTFTTLAAAVLQSLDA